MAASTAALLSLFKLDSRNSMGTKHELPSFHSARTSLNVRGFLDTIWNLCSGWTSAEPSQRSTSCPNRSPNVSASFAGMFFDVRLGVPMPIARHVLCTIWITLSSRMSKRTRFYMVVSTCHWTIRPALWVKTPRRDLRNQRLRYLSP